MRVLVVDDEARVTRHVGQAIAEVGHAVDSAFDGERALQLALACDYDAIVLDLMLPYADGFTVCRRLRSSGRRAPVLIISARDLVEDRIRALDAGADDYLVKPFAIGELLARLRALLRRGAPTTTILRIADLELDPAALTVKRDGRRIALTQKEFGLLECLLRRPGIVFTRAMLAEHVWDFAFENASNVVDVYVRHVRAKIDDPGKPSFIQTVRGTGYVLRDPDAPVA